MNTAKKSLNFEALGTILSELTSHAEFLFDERFQGVTSKLLEMKALVHDLNTLKSESDLREIHRQLQVCQQECKEEMNRFLNRFGTNVEETEAYFNNPANFSQEEWTNFQSVKREMLEAVESPGSSPMYVLSKKKN